LNWTGVFGAVFFVLVAVLPLALNQEHKYKSVFPSQHVNVSSSRKLGYIEYGDPTGFPVFVLQSFLQGRTSHTRECELIDKKFGIRVLVLDRPGYGTSTSPPPNFSLQDMARDVLKMADILEIDQFALVGISAGAVYALAAQEVIPPSRLSSIVLISPGHPDPYQENRSDCEDTVLDSLKLVAYHAPILPRLLFNFFRWWCLYMFPEDAFPPFVMEGAFTKGEIAHFREIGSWNILTDACMESMAQGIEGVLSDLSLISMKWTFQISSVNQDPKKLYNILMLHGEQDSIVNHACARYYEVIPNLTANYYSQSGHGLFGNETVWERVIHFIVDSKDKMYS